MHQPTIDSSGPSPEPGSGSGAPDLLDAPDPAGVAAPADERFAAPPPPPPSAPRSHRRSRGSGGFRQWLVAGLAGGLVGALVASGVFVAIDGSESDTVAPPSAESTASQPSRIIDGGSGVAAIIERVEPAVVAITTGAGPGSGDGSAGTGFVITADGYVVTNNHVVDGASRITVAFTNGDEKGAELVGREAATDIAVLKVDGENLATVELGDSDGVEVGDEVVAIGNALALDGGLSVTRGIVSGLHRTVNTTSGSTLIGMLQTDAAINPGNSGGPLVDGAGRVIAINTAIANPQAANNVGFAIPIANARPVIDDLRLGRPAAYLGVSSLSVTPTIARQQGLAATSGALVTRVTAGSAAEQAGVEEGDVIVSIAGDPVTEASDVQALVRGHRPGDTVDVVVIRDGEELTLRATLTERPAA